jgi:hypothetical protein
MTAHGAAVAETNAHAGAAPSIPLTIAAAVLAGAGLWLIAYWLITFHWIYFSGIALLAGGALLLFSRVTGPDRA